MRTYGRNFDTNGNPTGWVEVSSDVAGNNDAVYLTTLAQTLKLNLGESPFYANYGLPAFQTIVTQIFPDFYVMKAQAQFMPYFASLVISRVIGTQEPTYNVQAVTHNGSVLEATIPT